MELIRNIPMASVDSDWLDEWVTIDNLPLFCRSIDKVIESGDTTGRIYCLWGEFEVHRWVAIDGLKFGLPGCPNQLSWTLRLLAGQGLEIRCCITTASPEPDFVESIELFLDDWVFGLDQQFGKSKPQGIGHENLG